MEKWVFLNSSNLESVSYDPIPKNLVVEFKNGSLYVYKQVEREIYDGLINAESAGKYFAENIRGHFQYERIDTQG